MIYARDIIGIVLGLAILMFFIFKGVNIYITGLVSVVVLAIVSGVGYDAATEAWLNGWKGYLGGYLILFMMGGLFGKMMEISKQSISVAKFLIEKLGNAGALFAIGATAGIMTYSGVSIFISVTAIVPICLEVFRQANIPHRYLPAVLLYGAYAIGHSAPGNPMANNLIPYQYLSAVDPSVTMMSGAVIGWIVCIGMFITSWLLLSRMIKKSQANGENFSLVSGESMESADGSALPNPILSFVPMISVIVLMNLKNGSGTALFPNKSIALFLAMIVCILTGFKYINWKKDFVPGIGASAQSTLLMITGMCAIIGFASVVKLTPSFAGIVDAILSIPGGPLMSAFVFTSSLCAITGSGSGGIAIVAPIMIDRFAISEISFRALTRVLCMSSVGLDSLPHNGAVVGVTRVCNETTASSYWPICVVTLIVTTVGAFIATILFSIFPFLP